MRTEALVVIIALSSCGPTIVESRRADERPALVYEPIDNRLVRRAINALLYGDPWPEVTEALFAHRHVASEREQVIIDALIRALERHRDASADRIAAFEAVNALVRVHPEDRCLYAIRAVDLSDAASDEQLDTFIRCFPDVALGHSHAGARCDRRPAEPAAREAQLRGCIRHLTRCIALDPTNTRCAARRAKYRDEYLSPYCTPLRMRADFGYPAGRQKLDVLDFAYAYEEQGHVVLVLSPRGMHALSGSDHLTAQNMALTDVCSTTQRRDAESLE